MAILLEFQRCPCCGQFHDFWLSGDYHFSPAATYSFVCPVARQVGELKGLNAHGSPVNPCPPPAVELRVSPQ
jgi:hypothetical protein